MPTDSEPGAGIETAASFGIDRPEAGRPGRFGPDVIRAMEQVTSLAQALDAGHQRIQFTPDLLPADLIGT